MSLLHQRCPSGAMKKGEKMSSGTHVRVRAVVDPGADEGDELVAALVHHEAADLALVALLPETPARKRKER